MIKGLLKIEIDPKRIYGLDILRALAILFVVVGHGKDLLPENLEFIHKIVVFDGVSIFFVLSGFLIGGILIKLVEKKEANKKTLFDFWKRRWFRTLPNYFLILLIITIYSQFNQIGFEFSSVKSYFIFSQNLLNPHPSFFPEAWSLSVEEWFYLIVPVCLFGLISIFKIRPQKSILIAAISILALVVLFRIYRYINLDIESAVDWGRIFRKQVFTRLDSLMFGVIGAYVQYYYPKKWNRNKLPMLVLGISIFALSKCIKVYDLVAFDSFYNCVVSFSFTSIATLLLLPFLSNLRTGSGAVYKGITVISLISYSMYLLNLTIVHKIIIRESIPWHLLPENLFTTVILKYSAYWIFTLLGSIILYKYYEIPLTRLRDKKIG